MTKTILIRHENPAWSDDYAARLSARFPEARFHAAQDLSAAMALAPEVEAFIGIGPQMTPELVAAMPRLEWIQSLTTGVDRLLTMEELAPGLPISRVMGVHGPQMSELALMLMLALARDLPGTLAAQKAHRWNRSMQPLVLGKTLCILGLGAIAETLAGYAGALGMRVTGVSGRDSAPGVDRIYPRAAMAKALAEADFVVVLTPLTDATRNIIDTAELKAMKPSAFLINIARGGCVNEVALIAALKSGEIAGAGIDVFEHEPLPADDPMWDAPNCILTPHVGGLADIYHEQCLPTVIENLSVYLTDGPNALKDTVSR